jgi:D-aminopeptidase
MRVYISVDMEGVAGVVHEDQTDPTQSRHAGEYNRFRRLMTRRNPVLVRSPARRCRVGVEPIPLKEA